jgi:outer membrane protein
MFERNHQFFQIYNVPRMTRRIITSVFVLAFCLPIMTLAQETWDLRRCITYALDNNLTIMQAKANVKTTLLAEQQAKTSRLPNVSASVNAGEQFGRTIDPTTNQFNNTGIAFNSMSLNAGVNVFNGGLVHHSIKQAGWNLRAAEADASQSGNTLALQVASAYLNILLNEERLNNAKRRVEQSQAQLNNTLKLIEAGSLPPAEKFVLQARIAADEQAQVISQNDVDLSYLNLKQLLQLEPDFDLRIERPAVVIPVDANPDGYTLPVVYDVAINNQPNIRAADYRIKSSEEGIAIAKSAYYPTLSIFANLSSNYSSGFLDYDNGTAIGEPTLSRPETINVNGQDLTFRTYRQEFDFPRIPYFTQLDRNFGQGFGVNLNIPIYQNGRTRLSVERAKLGVLNSQLQSTQAKQQLKNDIQTAIANARSAKLQLDAAEKTFAANQIAYQNVEKRRTLGAVNTLEFTTAKTNLDTAENDVTLARYNYLFRLKILDFYQGKELSLN